MRAPALWLGVVLLAACTRTMPAPQAPAPPPLAGLHAGAARIDITPPPGLGLWGHGPEGRIAVGTLMHLRCQAFVLAGSTHDGRPEAVALAACDLSAPSMLLQRRIAEQLATRGVPISAGRLLLMATHTHAGPAHYFAAQNMSGPMSTRLFGFDDDVVTWLADRIARGIANAWQTAQSQPARAAWAHEPVWGLSRNRSPSALRHDRPLPAPLTQSLAAPALPAELSEAERSVDPTLAVLRIDVERPAVGHDPQWAALGALAFFGVHPSATANTNVLYHGDLFGYATRAAERHLAAHTGGDVIVGLANSIEGDVTANVDERSVREARRVGEALAEHIAKLWQGVDWSAVTSPQTLDVAYQELPLSGARLRDGRRLCKRPELGAAAAGGASDHPTRLRLVGRLNPGVHTIESRGCQGHKVPILPVTGHNQAGVQYGAVAPISQIALAGGLLATVPAEPTTVTGMRLRAAIARAASGPSHPAPSPIVVASLTNAYLFYVATAEEYSLQHYEGASTLYGPHTAALLTEQHACLTARLLDGDEPIGCAYRGRPAVNTLSAVEYSPMPGGDRLFSRGSPAPLPPAELLGPPRPVLTEDGRAGLELDWRGPAMPQGEVRERLLQRVVIEQANGGSAVADSARDGTVAVRWVSGSERTWCAVWTPAVALGEAQCNRAYRFVVHAGGSHRSAAASLSCHRVARRPCQPGVAP